MVLTKAILNKEEQGFYSLWQKKYSRHNTTNRLVVARLWLPVPKAGYYLFQKDWQTLLWKKYWSSDPSVLVK